MSKARQLDNSFSDPPPHPLPLLSSPPAPPCLMPEHQRVKGHGDYWPPCHRRALGSGICGAIRRHTLLHHLYLHPLPPTSLL
eukprot:758496-Hanusia_phi.AAC.4